MRQNIYKTFDKRGVSHNNNTISSNKFSSTSNLLWINNNSNNMTKNGFENTNLTNTSKNIS